MKKSSYYYKALTKAEVGNTGTHEIYVRMPNDFDYEGFFNQKAVANGTVLEVKFTAIDITNTEAIEEPIRFVYFANSNKEKRMPGLGSLFAKHNVQEGDIFFMESVLENATTTIYIKFFKNGSMDLQPGQIYFTKIHSDEHIISFNKDNSLPLQQIFYGAPGTGKSHKVNKEIQNTANALVFRTTFHPDSDYSTFVGAYKPTMKSADRLYSADELIDKLSEIKTLGHTYPCHKFAAKYWYSLKGLSAADIKRIVVACDFPESMTVEVGKGIAIGEEMAKHVQNDKIVYSFVPQAFLKAYVAAWQNQDKPVFLVIEELNRGNCAQIFGDIFQLLDRKDNGESEYPIKADQDIRKFLAKEFTDVEGLENDIQSGKVLVLPSNLYIWATMNTSDQSLFPIDSAFKRRWDWEYVPIKYANGNWVIEIGDLRYSWVSFQKIVNKKVYEINHSEDKMLGDFFVKANDQDVITEKVLINKILFYLWNDVCKDGEGDIFKKDANTDLTFSDLYSSKGTENLIAMMKYLEVEEMEDDGNDGTNSGTQGGSEKRPKYSINDSEKTYSTPESVVQIISDFANAHPEMSVDEMIATWNRISGRNNLLVDSYVKSPKDKSSTPRRTEITWNNKSVWVARAWTEELFQTFAQNVKEELGIEIVKVN